MTAELYSGPILDYAARAPEARSLDRADVRTHKRTRLCGSEVWIDLALNGDRIADCACRLKLCLLGQACVGIVHPLLEGACIEEVCDACRVFIAMLREKGPPPQQKGWSETALLRPVADYPSRIDSAVLFCEALAACLEASDRAPAESP